jgi:hypothetical protein
VRDGGDGAQRFDPDEAHDRLSATLESASGDIRCSLWKGRTSNGSATWSLLVQVGQGRNGCRGGIRIDERPIYDDQGRFLRWGVAIGKGMSYPLALWHPEGRRALIAVWAECERQGVIERLT